MSKIPTMNLHRVMIVKRKQVKQKGQSCPLPPNAKCHNRLPLEMEIPREKRQRWKDRWE